MADQQPGDEPAAGQPVEGGGEPSTVDAPGRFSASAAVPPPTPKKSRNSRRAARLTEAAAPQPEHEPTAVDPHDWASMPAVDPWADQDTPWDAFPLPPEPPMPPTRVDRPATTRIDAPPPAAAPPVAPRGRWGRKAKPAQPVNRLPVQPRPITQQQPPIAARPPMAAPRPPIAAPRPPVGPPAGQGRPLPPAPPWAPRPPQRPLPPPRKRRRRGRRFGLVVLLGLLCCCGGPLAYYNFPAARQYPVTAALPQSFLDLDRRDDDASKRAADRLAKDAAAAGKASSSFAGVYGDGDGKRVTVFGVTGWRFDPGKDVHTELSRLSDEFNINDVRSFPGGEFGVYEQCGVGRSSGNQVVVCAWADHGSLATVLLTRRSLQESAGLVEQLRGAVLTSGITPKAGGIPLL
jgi:hypothetical protein